MEKRSFLMLVCALSMTGLGVLTGCENKPQESAKPSDTVETSRPTDTTKPIETTIPTETSVMQKSISSKVDHLLIPKAIRSFCLAMAK